MGNILPKRFYADEPVTFEMFIGAIKRDDYDLFEKFIKQNQSNLDSLNAVGDQGWNALAWAVINNRRRMVTRLREIPEVDVNQHFPQHANLTVLMLASRLGHIDDVEDLQQREDLEVNAVSDSGRTAIFYAVIFDEYFIVEILLDDSRVDKTHSDPEGETAHSLAIRENLHKIAKLIGERIAPPPIEKKETPLEDQLDGIQYDPARIPAISYDKVSKQIMTRPVTTSNGHTYDYSTIKRLADGKAYYKDPVTRRWMKTRDELTRGINWDLREFNRDIVAEIVAGTKKSNHSAEWSDNDFVELSFEEEKQDNPDNDIVQELGQQVDKLIRIYEKNEADASDALDKKTIQNKINILKPLLDLKSRNDNSDLENFWKISRAIWFVKSRPGNAFFGSYVHPEDEVVSHINEILDKCIWTRPLSGQKF